jgi:hypothetical protein
MAFTSAGSAELLGRNAQMHARPTIKALLIRRKLLRWRNVAKCPILDPRCPPWRARKNCWRLLKKYPLEGADLGLTELSVYDRD